MVINEILHHCALTISFCENIWNDCFRPIIYRLQYMWFNEKMLNKNWICSVLYFEKCRWLKEIWQCKCFLCVQSIDVQIPLNNMKVWILDLACSPKVVIAHIVLFFADMNLKNDSCTPCRDTIFCFGILRIWLFFLDSLDLYESYSKFEVELIS